MPLLAVLQLRERDTAQGERNLRFRHHSSAPQKLVPLLAVLQWKRTADRNGATGAPAAVHKRKKRTQGAAGRLGSAETTSSGSGPLLLTDTPLSAQARDDATARPVDLHYALVRRDRDSAFRPRFHCFGPPLRQPCLRGASETALLMAACQ